jgi:hypothetical protein
MEEIAGLARRKSDSFSVSNLWLREQLSNDLPQKIMYLNSVGSTCVAFEVSQGGLFL